MSARKGAASGEEGQTKVAIVKKYANRRLYNTATSSYVTLDELSRMVREGEEFLVYDAKSGEDITRSVLTQIILEEDGKGRNLMPIGFLRQLISFYDDSLHAFVPRYLELSMENFSKHQDQMRGYMSDTFGRFFPINQFEDMARQNVALFSRAATMFRPFANADGSMPADGKDPATQDGPADQQQPATSRELQELRRQMEALQRQMDELDTSTRKDRS